MNKDTSLFNNSLYNVLYKLLNVFFPLLSSAYVSHVLLATGVGRIASAQNIAQYFVLVAALGLPNYGTREIAKVRDDSSLRNKTFSELFFINLISTVLCSVAYYTLIFENTFFDTNRSLYLIVGLSIVFNAINIDWLYQGLEDYKYIAARSFVIKILSLIALFVFVKNENDCEMYALIYVLAIAGNYIFNIINLKKKKIKFSFAEIRIKRHIKPVMILLCTTIAIELYTLLDTTMLTYLSAAENVAYYTNSIKIVRILITAVSAIGGVLLPRLSYYKSQQKIEECSNIVSKIFQIMLFIFLPCGFGLMITAKYLIPVFFGTSFGQAVFTLQIASLLVYALGFSNLFGTQVLLTFDDERRLLLCTVVGALSNIFMNAILIPRYQQNGAVVASVVSEMLVTCMSFIFAKKYIKICINKTSVLKMIFSTVVMVIVTNFADLFCRSNNNWVHLMVMVVAGGVVYIASNIVLKNQIMMSIVAIIRREKESA